MRGPLLSALVGFVLSATAAAQKPANWIRAEVAHRVPLRLEEYGGANVEVLILSHDSRSVNLKVTDFTKEVPYSGRSGFGSVRSLVGPQVTTTAPKKRNGFSPDGRVSEAYPIYTDPLGTRVYFYDTLDTKQNHYVLLIVPAPPPIAEGPEPAQDHGRPMSHGDRLRALDQLKAEGLVTQEEYQQKRREILLGL